MIHDSTLSSASPRDVPAREFRACLLARCVRASTSVMEPRKGQMGEPARWREPSVGCSRRRRTVTDKLAARSPTASAIVRGDALRTHFPRARGDARGPPMGVGHARPSTAAEAPTPGPRRGRPGRQVTEGRFEPARSRHDHATARRRSRDGVSSPRIQYLRSTSRSAWA